MQQQHNPSLIGIGGPVEGGTFALAGEENSIGRRRSESKSATPEAGTEPRSTACRLRLACSEPATRSGSAIAIFDSACLDRARARARLPFDWTKRR